MSGAEQKARSPFTPYQNQSDRPSVDMSRDAVEVTFNCRAPKQHSEDSWLKSHEDILKDWKTKAFVDMWLQYESSEFYSNADNMISYPVIVLSSAASVTLFATNVIFAKYVIGIISIVTGFLTALGRQIRSSELSYQHSTLAKKYQVLIRTIDTCLDLPRKMRPNPDVLIEKIGGELDTLNGTLITPPYHVVKKFEKKFGSIHQLIFGDDIAVMLYKDLKARKFFRAYDRQMMDGTSPTIIPTNATYSPL